MILDDAAWDQVAATLPPRINSERRRAWARAKLERIATDYQRMKDARARWPTKHEIERVSNEARAIGFAMLRAAYSRNNDPARSLALYGRLLDMWRQMGGKLAVSKMSQGTPSGPLIRFLDASLRPVLGGNTPGPEGLAKIIKMEKKRIADLRAKDSPVRGFTKEHRGAPALWLAKK